MTTSATEIPVGMLAGSSPKDCLNWPNLPPEGKSHLDIAGRPMMDWVAESVSASGLQLKAKIGEWIPEDTNVNGCRLLKGNGSRVGNTLRLLDYLGQFSDRAFIITCDVPYATGRGIRDFAESAYHYSADVVIPVVDIANVQAAFPGSRSTTWKSSGLTVTMGNMMLLRISRLQANKDLAEKVIEARKHPVALARMLGPCFLLRFLLQKGRVWDMTTKYLERRIEQRTGVKIKTVLIDDPGLGRDADNPDSFDRINAAMLERLDLT